MTSASSQYAKRLNDSRYISLAQKLAEHIEKLDGDPNNRIRWIWELIQNAKDAPNEFNKVKILIQVKDKKLEFSHNGDPFKIKDLETLIGQYSSKPEKNKIETTGKYGTGFITTHILSRVINIKGILHLTPSEEQVQSSSESEEKQPNDQIEDQEKKQKNISKNQQMIQKKMEKAKDPNQVEIRQKKKTFGHFSEEGLDNNIIDSDNEEQNLNLQSFQHIQIKLDREYENRDKELVKKLKKSEQNLMRCLDEAEKKPVWKRSIDDLDTVFTYEKLNAATMRMINEAVQSVKALFGYCMVFNDKLYAIQVIDKRVKPDFESFCFERGSESKFHRNINLQNLSFKQANSKKQLYYAVLKDGPSESMIAVPVEPLEHGKLKLLEVNSKFEKVFKEFPLVGHEDTRFNFTFTSRKFFPNETRSSLFLEQMESRQNLKIQSNWQTLKRCFELTFELSISLSRYIDEGVQNLLKVSTISNIFDISPRFNDMKFLELIQVYKKRLSSLNIIRFKNMKKGCLKGMEYIFDRKHLNKEQSLNLNSIFCDFFSDQKMLSNSSYEIFFNVIVQYSEEWKDQIILRPVHSCLKAMETFSQISFQFFDLPASTIQIYFLNN